MDSRALFRFYWTADLKNEVAAVEVNIALLIQTGGGSDMLNS